MPPERRCFHPGIVALFAVAGSSLHMLLLLAPLAGLGLLSHALGDPAVCLFLLLMVTFSLADLPTLFHDSPSDAHFASAEDRLARRMGLIAGLLMLATFWAGLLERALAGNRDLGWPQGFGATLLLAGVALRAVAVCTLGRAFMTEWRVGADHGLIDHHIYAWVRHPSETGNLGILLGACLLLESRFALTLLLVFGPVTLQRICWEDQHLADVHGRHFRRYARRVKRLIPWIY